MKRLLALSTAIALGASGALADTKIGMITTLSGGGAGLGIDVRDGFMLAIAQSGRDDVEVVIEDDQRKPDIAVQLAARAFRARVIASASQGQHDRLRDLGAEPVEYGDDLVEAVRELAPDGVSVVVDLVGGVLEQTLAVLEDDGRHASIADGEVTQHGGSWIWVRPDAEALGRLVGLVEDGTVRIEVEDVFDLEDLADAFARSREGHVHGKLAVRVSED